MKDGGFEPPTSYEDIQAPGPVDSDEKMEQSDRPKMRLLGCGEPRSLHHPAAITATPMLRGLAPLERRARSKSKQGNLWETPRDDRAAKREARDD